MARSTGLGTVSILRPTVPKDDLSDPSEAPDAQPDDATDQSRGGEQATETRAPRPRRKRPPAGGKTTPRKYSVPDEVHERAELLAIKRKTSVSAIVADILDRNLPRLRIESD